MYCYEHKGGVTRDDFARLEEYLESNGTIGERDVEKSFVKNCCKKGEIARSMNANYREYQSAREIKKAANNENFLFIFSKICNIIFL